MRYWTPCKVILCVFCMLGASWIVSRFRGLPRVRLVGVLLDAALEDSGELQEL